MGRQQLPERIQKGRKESFVFAFASLCGLLHGPKPALAAGLENYSMAPRTVFSEGLLEYSTIRRRNHRAFPTITRNHEKAVACEDVVPKSSSSGSVVLAIRSILVYSPLGFWIEVRLAKSPSR